MPDSKRRISPELVDKNSFNSLPLMGTKQHQRTVDAGKHTATVNVAHKNYIGSGMQGHRQIDKVGIPQIDFEMLPAPSSTTGL